MKKILILFLFVALYQVQMKANVTITDEESLLYIIEEEKLAHDIYVQLYTLWGSNQFNNIRNSEQTHMNTIAQLLTDNNISYNLLGPGLFNNVDLQNLYNQLITQGSSSLVEAFRVGMTIEDVDIYDLQIRIAETSNTAIINAYNFLICGSKNHMRAFRNGLINNGGTYTPQFITLEEYNTIISGTNGPCNTAAINNYYEKDELVYNTLVHDVLKLKVENFTKLFIYDFAGKIVTSIEEFQQEIDMSKYPTGTYFVKIIDKSRTYVVKIIKD